VTGSALHFKQTYDVIIVGFGPAGAVAACLLGLQGISTLVVEKRHTIYAKPRAVSIDHEVARILQNIGIGEELKAHVAPFTASEYFGVDGQLIKRLDMLPPPFPMGWTPSMVFMQPALEALVRRRANEMATVDIRLGVELREIAQDDEFVSAQLGDDAGGSFTVQARFLVGCDGASSTVRLCSGIPLDDLGFDQPWLVVDVLANATGLAKLPQVSAQYCQPARPTTYIVCTGNHRRWELMLLPGEDPRRMEMPAEVWRLLARWIDPADAELWRIASYRFHALVASEWRRGRIFVAGDAAHQQPPFLGQGMCQGVRDVANLVWKLERVLRNQSDARLLDSYGAERSAHVRQLHSVIIGIGGIVAERDEAAARSRDAVLLAQAGGTVRSVPRQQLQPALSAGCISPQGNAGRGTLFPQPMVAGSAGPKLLDEFTGARMRVVLSREFPPLTDAQYKLVKRLGAIAVRITDVAGPTNGRESIYCETESVTTNWFGMFGCVAAIVRPDHYVFGTASDSDSLTRELTDFALAVCSP
jgi:3-(3-hydroxy-phenyl)propionate hydroxylase